MDAHCEAILEEYRTNKPAYDELLSVILEMLHGIVDSLGLLTNSIEGRVKTESSLKGKLELKGYKYKSISDITDIIGCRIVTFYNSEIDKIAALLEKTFEIDWENSVDKKKIYAVDTFGYLSIHFICSIPKARYFNPEHPEINNVKFEIQLRTTLQHAWASIMHDTGYKNDIEVPREYLRAMLRLAGLLELADDEFGRIKNGLDDYRKRVKAIVASGNFDDVELNADSFNAYINSGAFDPLNKRIASINNMDIQETCLIGYLPVLAMLGLHTLGDVETLLRENEEDVYRVMVSSFSGTDIDIISSSISLQSLCFVSAIKKGFGLDQITSMATMIYGNDRNSLRRAKRFMELAKQIGILK